MNYFDILNIHITISFDSVIKLFKPLRSLKTAVVVVDL